jgi:hypothetical protein
LERNRISEGEGEQMPSLNEGICSYGDQKFSLSANDIPVISALEIVPKVGESANRFRSRN